MERRRQGIQHRVRCAVHISRTNVLFRGGHHTKNDQEQAKGREVRISFPIHTASADRGFGATLVTVSDVKKCEVLCKQRRKKKAE